MKYFTKTIITIIILAFAEIVSATELKIEAEDYSDMQGIQLENNNTNIGYFDAGDWLMFSSIDFDAANYQSIKFAVAKQSSGGAVQIRLDALDGTLIGTFYPESNNSWTNFETQQVNIEAVSGVHSLYLVGSGAEGICNMDYFILSEEKVYEPNWVLFWNDEFNGTDVDDTKWAKFYDGNPANGELQFYTPREENIVVSDGTLKLIARKETFTGQGPWMDEPVTRQYTSGKVETLGKITFKYGKFEAYMKLPRGKGTWPAFWMLGENLFDAGVGWPKCGEIDIMEHGQDFDNLGAAIHTEAYNHTIGTQKTGTYIIDDYDTDFHTYGLVWTENQLTFSVDGNNYFSVTKENLGDTEAEWPFDQPFWIILNHAVGGAWGGTPDDNLYPHTVEVDWVRVYKDEQISTSVKTNKEKTLKLYPTVTSDFVNLEFADNLDNHTIVVKDITGRVLICKRHIGRNYTLNMTSQPPGVYFLSYKTDSGKFYTEKFIKK